MRTQTRIIVVTALLSFAACGPTPPDAPRVLPVIYEDESVEGVSEITNLSQQPVSFNRGSLKISRQEILAEQVVPDENRILLRKSSNCGTAIASDRLQRLREKFSGKTALAYNLYPANRAPDQPVYHVIAIPNAPGYSTEKAVNDDLIDTCDVTMFPLVAMNADWLVFAGSSCQGREITEGCRLYDEEIRPTITLK